MKTKKKKVYERPVMQVVELQHQCLLHQASPKAKLRDYDYEDEQEWP